MKNRVKITLAILTLFFCGCSLLDKPHTPDSAPVAPKTEECRWNVGLDILGKNSPAWNCPAMIAGLKTLPCKIALGYFADGTFGPPNDACIQEAINTDKVWALRAHFAWSDHQPRTAQQLAPAALQFNALCAANPKIECYPSAVCENRQTAQTNAAVHAGLRPLLTAPNMKSFVDSGASPDPAAIRECHGNKKPCPIVSQDGGDGDGNGILDVDFEAVKKLGSMLTFGWGPPLNCKFSNKDKRKAKQRDDCPTAEQFLHFFAMLAPRPPFPPGRQAAPPQIYKPSSDNHGHCQGKDCKALWITLPFPGRQPTSIPYTTIDGKKLGEFVCYRCGERKEWHLGKYPRFYASEGAYPIFKRAKELSGSEFIVIDEGRAKIIVHPLHRGGAFR